MSRQDRYWTYSEATVVVLEDFAPSNGGPMLKAGAIYEGTIIKEWREGVPTPVDFTTDDETHFGSPNALRHNPGSITGPPPQKCFRRITLWSVATPLHLLAAAAD